MCSSCNYGSSLEVQEPANLVDMNNMVKQVIQDATMDLQKILHSAITSTTASETASVKLPEKSNARDADQVTSKQKLLDSFAKIISTAESITGVNKRVTQKPTVFFLKQQSPTAHLSVLRNPTRAYEKSTPAFSPALGHTSDAYIRFKQRQWLQDRMTVENGDFMQTIKNPAHRMAQKQRYKTARKSLSQIQRDHDGWIYNRQPGENLCEEVHKDALFWRSLHEDRQTVSNQDGEKEQQWVPNDNDLLLGEAIETEMQMQGRSIEEWAGLKKAVQDLEQEQRHQRMVKHREQWRKSKYIPEEYNSDTDEEDLEEDDDEDDGHLYDDVDAPQVKISEVDAKDEAIARSPASLTGIPQIKIANVEECPALFPQHHRSSEPHPDNIVETKPTNTNVATRQEFDEMASTTAKTSKEVVTETDAILSLANNLLSDLKERQDFYYRSSNVHMNNVLEAMRPRTLGYKCSWNVRPMAMTKKNLTPPPVDQVPAIRLTNPSGVTCELIEGFQELSTPWFEDYVAWRDEEQDVLIQAVQEWREKEETFDEYDRRLVCEEFWDECLEKDLKRVMEERKNWEDMNVIFEDDSDDDDGCDWGEYSCSRMSRSSSITTSVPDLEEDTVEPVAEEEETEPKTETETATALEAARTNLNEFNTILATAVVSAKTEAIASQKVNLKAPKVAKEAEEAKGFKDRYPHNLSYSITHLRLRMAEDGLMSSDNTGFIYTSSKPTGPGSITFTGPIRNFLTANKRVHDRAFNTLTNDIRVQAINDTDFYKEVRLSMAHVTDLYRDVRKAKVLEEEARVAKKKMEDKKRVWQAVMHEGVAEAEKWGREREGRGKEKNEEKEDKEEMEMAVKVMVSLGIAGVGVELGVGGKAKKGKAKSKGKGKGKKRKGRGKGKGKGKK
ncbi:hypothetical protein DL98DRAFT_652850 [Cadophora sp. DSE1049]|nr:hypothetical protein DL98DRAFT_652850 [Cadophora sp. DSE1049]